jgi:hypothetical protein
VTLNAVPTHSYDVNLNKIRTIKGNACRGTPIFPRSLLRRVVFIVGGQAVFLKATVTRKQRSSYEAKPNWDSLSHDQIPPSTTPTRALAISPAEFAKGGDLRDGRATSDFSKYTAPSDSQRYKGAERQAFHFTFTNQGIEIELPLHFIDDLNGLALGILNVYTKGTHRRAPLPLVRANRFYSNIFTKAPGCTLFILPKEYTPPPSSERIYIQYWAKEAWEIASSLDSDHSLFLTLHLVGNAWRDEGWNCHGWFPSIPLAINSAIHRYRSVSRVFPPQFLATFSNQTWSILCFLVSTVTEQGFELKVKLTAFETPALTPFDVLYSAISRRVEFPRLEEFRWTVLDGSSALRVKEHTVRRTVKVI